jgi:DNA-binding IscR family transcriptional regulator
LVSQRGVKGGYSFARPPEELTVLEVVEALEGRLGAEATGIFADAVGALRGQLGSVTIAEVATREAGAAGAAMYYI